MAKYTWKSIDWHKSTRQISNELGCAITQVSHARRKYAPETTNHYKSGAKYPWDMVDWNKSTRQISNELGCASTQVSRARRMYAPETSKKQAHPKPNRYAWDTVDWNKSTRQISNELGCNYQYASEMRHKIGFPKKRIDMTMLSVRVTDALYSELEKQASERGYKLSEYMREILTQFLENSNV